MRDVLYLALVIGFFALGAAYIRACAAIVGRDPVLDGDADADPAADPAHLSAEAGL